MQTCLHLKSLSYGQQGVTSPVSKRKPFDCKLMRKTALLLPWFITSVNSFLTGLWCDCHNILSNYGHFLVQIRAVNKSSKFEHIFEYLKKQNQRSFDCENEYWKTHQRLLCEWSHCMMGQGRVTGAALAQRHSLLNVRRGKNCGRCRWRREKQNGKKVQSPTWQQREWGELQAT